MSKQWFHDWFNSPYYHLLYRQHNQFEAERFIDKLLQIIKPATQSCILDVACGRGRHSVYLNKKGLNVTGIDLSVTNITYARQFENESLHFYVHDMRALFYKNHFDVALNLFTSFGYFDNMQEHVDALKCINSALKKDGMLIIDYFNAPYILKNLVTESIKTIDGIDFHIHKAIQGDCIVKTITFEDRQQGFQFKERVKTFTLDDFKALFAQSGFELVQCFGNYQLDDFDVNNSERLIMICKKAYA